MICKAVVRDQGSEIRDQRSGVRDQGSGVRGGLRTGLERLARRAAHSQRPSGAHEFGGRAFPGLHPWLFSHPPSGRRDSGLGLVDSPVPKSEGPVINFRAGGVPPQRAKTTCWGPRFASENPLRRFTPQPFGLGPMFPISSSLVARRYSIFVAPRTREKLAPSANCGKVNNRLWADKFFLTRYYRVLCGVLFSHRIF
jgi:hypothetical protein